MCRLEYLCGNLLEFLLGSYVSFFHTLQIASLANSLRVLAEMKEPIGAVSKRTEVGGHCLSHLGGS